MVALLQVTLLILAAAVLALDARQSRRLGTPSLARLTLAAIAGANILFVIFLWLNHINFPVNLDLLEGTILQHFERAMEGLPIYPEPTPAYVPLAYNPLYYVLAVPFAWVFGVSLFTLRLVAILAMLGSGLIIYRVVHERTDSVWWALMATGLFAAAYRVMDSHLDVAHPDSCFLFAALLGTYIVDRYRSPLWNLIGVVVLVAAFWFKQHGAVFAMGGLLFLTWRDGLTRSWPYWVVATLVGPVLYIFAGPSLFGSHFHYFTWEVPHQWSELRIRSFGRYAVFILTAYPVLAVAGGFLTLWTLATDRRRLDVWQTQFVFAAVTGLVGALDRGSSDNVFIPMGTWFILVGTVALHELGERAQALAPTRAQAVALFVTFWLLVYDPREAIVSRQATESYNQLVAYLRSLHGTVYAPSIGQLQSGYAFFPTPHWVALEDMIRGPGRSDEDSAVVRRYLEPALRPEGPAFILANERLGSLPCLAFLQAHYVLDADFGGQFAALRVLPRRWDFGWPRFLYRYDPQAAQQTAVLGQTVGEIGDGSR